jgi:histidine triad (HIT) family protein
VIECIFCAIAAGDVPSAKVYKDDRVFAFLDIHPLRRGHVLVIPRTHSARLEEADPDDAAALVKAARLILGAMPGLTGDHDATIAINNGQGAGQEVAHLHLHIVPRSTDDGAGPIHALFDDRPHVSDEDLKVLAAQFQEALGVSD